MVGRKSQAKANQEKIHRLYGVTVPNIDSSRIKNKVGTLTGSILKHRALPRGVGYNQLNDYQQHLIKRFEAESERKNRMLYCNKGKL